MHSVKSVLSTLIYIFIQA